MGSIFNFRQVYIKITKMLQKINPCSQYPSIINPSVPCDFGIRLLPTYVIRIHGKLMVNNWIFSFMAKNERKGTIYTLRTSKIDFGNSILPWLMNNRFYCFSFWINEILLRIS